MRVVGVGEVERIAPSGGRSNRLDPPATVQGLSGRDAVPLQVLAQRAGAGEQHIAREIRAAYEIAHFGRSPERIRAILDAEPTRVSHGCHVIERIERIIEQKGARLNRVVAL